MIISPSRRELGAFSFIELYINSDISDSSSSPFTRETISSLERDDNRRNKAVNDFYSRIFNQAQSDLIAKIKESVRDQCDLVKEQLEGRKNEIARITSGGEVSAIQLENAEQMLKNVGGM